ncbi:Transcription factor TFIIIC triple barrel domain-containing protein [Pleurotus pulmonarius]
MPSAISFSGYKHVDAFGAEDDYEGGEEVSYVTLDLGVIEPTLVPSSAEYRLIGLDTPTPFLQLSGTIFKGQHDSLLGTELLFMEEKDASGRALHHVGSAEQRIRFKEVELQRKSAGDDPQSLQAKGKGKEKASTSSLPTFLSGSDNVDLVDRIAGSDVRFGDEPLEAVDPDDAPKRARRKGKKKEGEPEQVARRRSTRKKPGEDKLIVMDDDEMDVS